MVTKIDTLRNGQIPVFTQKTEPFYAFYVDFRAAFG